MSAQDNTEKVLRSLHVLLSKSEPYPGSPGKVVIEKQQVLDLLSELNKCIYDIMDEYELTKQSRDKAEREFRKQGDDIVWDASRRAEDIYAASVMYMDEALNRLQEIMQKAEESVQDACREMEHNLEERRVTVRENQKELKAQLQDLVDSEKYLRLIEDRNREIQREKDKKTIKPRENAAALYADRQTEVKVNQDVLRKLGLAADEVPLDEPEPVKKADGARPQRDPDSQDERRTKEGHKGWMGFGNVKNKKTDT